MVLRPTAWLLVMMAIGPILTSVSQPSGVPTAGGWLLVANKGDQTLGIVDPDSGRQVATVPVGGTTGHEVVASPDGRTAYVPIYGNSGVGKPGTDGQTLTVIDVGDRQATKTIDFGRPVRPHCAVFGPKNGLLYITTELTNSLPSSGTSVPSAEPLSKGRIPLWDPPHLTDNIRQTEASQ